MRSARPSCGWRSSEARRRSPASPTPAESGAATRTRSSAHRRSSPSPTAWAAPRRARSPPASRQRHSASSTRRDDPGPGGPAPVDHPGGKPPDLRPCRERPPGLRHGHDSHGRAGSRRSESRSATSGTRVPTGSETAALEQLTQDHSLVADLVRSGRLTPEEAEVHPQRSVITRALGTDAAVVVDSFSIEAPRRRRLPSLLGRSHDDGRRGDRAARDDRELPTSSTAARALVGGGERERRRGQHHRRALHAAEEGDATRTPSPGSRASIERRRSPPEPSGADGGSNTIVRRCPSSAARRRCRRRGRRAGRAGLFARRRSPALFAGIAALALFGASPARTSSAPTEEGSVAVYQGVPWDVSGGERCTARST